MDKNTLDKMMFEALIKLEDENVPLDKLTIYTSYSEYIPRKGFEHLFVYSIGVMIPIKYDPSLPPRSFFVY